MQKKPTYRFGLLGHPVGHSLSPVMHEASFRSLGIDAEYHCFDVAPQKLADKLAECRAAGFAGLNITVPHKAAALGLMDRLDNSARLFGAVNTVRIEERGLTGFNTDADGFLEDLAINHRTTPEDLTVMVLGCGGAGRALSIACASHGADRLLLAELAEDKAAQVADEIREKLPDVPLDVEVLAPDQKVWAERCLEADLVIQCTPVGLRHDDPAVMPPEAFRRGQLLYDLVYTRRVTPTMGAAISAGAEAVNGAGMLVYQGAAAFMIWTAISADTAAMRQALEERIYKNEN